MLSGYPHTRQKYLLIVRCPSKLHKNLLKYSTHASIASEWAKDFLNGNERKVGRRLFRLILRGPRRTRRTDTTPFGQTRDLRKLRSQFTFQQLVRGPTHSASSALNECTQCDERQTEFALGLMCFKERSPFGVYADYIEVINNCVRVGLSDLFAAHRYR